MQIDNHQPPVTRLILDLPVHVHAYLTEQAISEGVTIQDFLIEHLLEKKEVDHQRKWQDLASWAQTNSPLLGKSHLVEEARQEFRKNFDLTQ